VNAPSRTMIGQLVRSHGLIPTALRFGIIGISSGLLFIATTSLLVHFGGASPQHASIAMRFVCVHLFNIVLTFAIMSGAVAHLGLAYAWGMAGVVVIIPIVNFVLAKLWIFGQRSSARQADQISGGSR
jgi:putative flippase GtrA